MFFSQWMWILLFLYGPCIIRLPSTTTGIKTNEQVQKQAIKRGDSWEKSKGYKDDKDWLIVHIKGLSHVHFRETRQPLHLNTYQQWSRALSQPIPHRLTLISNDHEHCLSPSLIDSLLSALSQVKSQSIDGSKVQDLLVRIDLAQCVVRRDEACWVKIVWSRLINSINQVD